MDLVFETSKQIISVIIPKNSTIDDVKLLIKEKLNAKSA